MTGWHVFRREPYQLHSVVVLAVLALSVGGVAVGAAQGTPQGVTATGAAGHEVVTLTTLSAERGREFLSRLKLATASKLPGGNALLVTGEPSEVSKAITVLSLVDSRIVFDVQELGPAVAGQVPSSAQIAALVGGVAIGTFANPPQDKEGLRAVVDVHRGTLVAIAPTFRMPNIKRAVTVSAEILKQEQASVRTPDLTPTAAPQATAQPMEWTTPVDANSSQTIQSAAMLGSSLSSQTAVVNRDAARTQTQTEEPASAREIQSQSPETRALAAGAAPFAAKPEPTAPTAATPTGGTPAEKPADTSAAQSRPPAEARQENAAPAKVAEPVAAEPRSPQPQPTAPSSATTQTQPEPQTTPVAASPAATSAPAAASPFRADVPNGDQVLDLTLQDRMPVIQLLDLAGKYLGLSYVYNPDDVKGEVSLKLNGDLRGQIRVSQLYPLLEQSLRQLNLVTTRHKGNVVSIAPIAKWADIDPILIDRPGSRVETGDTVVTCRFEVKHIDTTAAKNLLDAMYPGLNATPVAEKHMLIVTTYNYRMERIERLLQMVDQPGEPKKFKSRQLRYTMAKALTDKVKAMAEQMLDSVNVTVAESDNTPSLARQPGENDIAYRTRVNALRAQQTALRAQQAALRAQTGGETKPSIYLDADERTNRVLMIGAEKQLAIVEPLVDALDVQQQDLRALQLYRMQHVDAEEMARKLVELGIISKLPDGPTSSRYPTAPSRITTPLPGQPRPPTSPTTPEVQVSPTTEVTEKGLVEEPQVVVVEATNSLLVNATDEQHAKIANIIKFVDSETLTNEIPYKIYKLENSSPDHLSKVLQDLIQETVEQQKEGGKIEKVVVSKDDKIKIVPDPNTYSLIVYANKKNQEWISNLVTQLDKRRPQVLIDVTLVSITNHNKFDYDLNLLRGWPNLASTSAITNVSTEKAIGTAVGTAGGALTAFYGDKQVQALLETMQEKTYGRVLAKPKLLVNDNEPGKIDSKDITYVEVTSSLPVGSGVPGTTSGLVQTSTNFTSYDAGITLDITPHISEGDLLRLDIKLVRSDFGVMLGQRPPDKKSSEVDTAVTLPNGATVILGGLVKATQTKGGSKVPILGDIPLVGGLFRSIHNKEEGENLYMFVKAEIIRPEETSSHGMKDLEVLSERNRQAFEKRELEFQTYQDWPGLKSKRIDPPKVLDAQ